jgi:hypothetical protein
MAENGRVHPGCVNAANPYHECGVACLEKISDGKGRKDKKKSGSKIISLSGSFGRKKKETPPRTLENGHAVSARSPAPHIPFKKDTLSDNSRSFSSSEPYSEEMDHSFHKERGESSRSQSVTGNNTPDISHLPVSDSTLSISNLSDEKRRSLAQIFSYGSLQGLDDEENESTDRSMKFSFSGVAQTSAESDDEEIQPVVSDSCIPGKYHVQASAVPILQSIVNKYGDIAVNCHLQSVSMRAYYLECLCSVVQELQSTPIVQLTKGKVKEMLAVLKDVESAKIDVTWLRSILDEVSGVIDLMNKHHTLESAKANCNGVLESTKKELESRLEDVAQKEQAVAEAKEQMEEIKARLNKLELESSQLNNTLTTVKSKVDAFQGKSVADGLL